jgi:hypothetical protein
MADTRENEFSLQSLQTTLVLPEFQESLDNAAASLFTEFYAKGILELGASMTTTRWALTHTVVNPTTGTSVTGPYPTLPGQPETPAGNTTNATVSIYKQEQERYSAVMRGITKLRTAVLRDACDDTLRAELRGLPGGLANQSLPMILDYIDTQFGTLSLYDLRVLQTQIDVPGRGGQPGPHLRQAR